MNWPKLKLLYSNHEILQKVRDLATEIEKDYQGKDPLLIGVLKGSFVFLSDLVRSVRIPVRIDFVRLASYGSHTVSSGNVRITKDIELDVAGQDLLIVEDIVDTGLTLQFLYESVLARNPRSLRICSLINKTSRREVEVTVDYTGFTLEGGFLVGYGLDLREQYRNLPDIHEVIE
jgi:hypoxanthine phosphoribosyltransferase